MLTPKEKKESLNLSRNRIMNLYVMQLSASRSILRELDLSFNQISTVSDLPALTALESLNLYGNPLDGALAVMASKLPASLINAVCAFILAPIIYKAIAPILNKNGSLSKVRG